MDNPNVEFTRDVAGALKERAEAQSMMAKHASAQREAMQEACLGALRKALPGASAETCLMALETANWDVDRAHAQVKAFMGAAATVAGGGGSGKGRSSKKSKRRRRDDSGSDSDSSSASSSSSSSSSRKKSKKSRKSKKSKKEKKGKKETKGKKDAKKHRKEAPEPEFGAKGFIKETDKYDKEGEFRAWLGEVKKLDVESLQKWEEKELFKEYAEDYNTATLPHEKFYNLEKWSREEAARRAREDPTAAAATAAIERERFNDEEERKREIQAERERRDAEYKRETYLRMRSDSGDLENLREQERLKELRKNAYNMGDMETVARVNKILAPDEPDAGR